MLTKTLTFDELTLEIIRSLAWNIDGTSCVIIDKLDRKQYEAVNKALEAMGGKWNRKTKCHIFETDPRPMVAGLLENGSLTVEKDGFFETPRAVVERMIELAPIPREPDSLILEPSAGLGAIARVLLERGANWMVLFEKNQARAEKLRVEFQSQDCHVYCMDFLKVEPIPLYLYDRIYMNPPFEQGQDVDHIMHAFKHLAVDGYLVSVVSEHPFFAGDQKSVEFRQFLVKMGAYQEKLPENSFRESGTDVNTRLIVIRK